MGLYSLFGLDRYSVLTGLTENVILTGNMSDNEDKKVIRQRSVSVAQLDENILKKNHEIWLLRKNPRIRLIQYCFYKYLHLIVPHIQISSVSLFSPRSFLSS